MNEQLNSSISEEKVNELYDLMLKQKQPNPSIFLIPLSILFAGLLIAGVLLYNGKTATSQVTAALTATPTTASFTTATVTLSESQIEGNKNAKIALVEFSDYQCPYCDQFFKQSLPQIESTYVQPGKVLHAFKDFPLTTIHPNAMPGAIAAQCAGDQGKYWQMHDKIYSTDQSTNDASKLASYAQDLGLNTDQYNSCVSTNKFSSQIQTDIDQGTKLGVQGTPTFVLGKIDKKNNTVTGTVLYGAYPYDQYQTLLDSLLKKA